MEGGRAVGAAVADDQCATFGCGPVPVLALEYEHGRAELELEHEREREPAREPARAGDGRQSSGASGPWWQRRCCLGGRSGGSFRYRGGCASGMPSFVACCCWKEGERKG